MKRILATIISLVVAIPLAVGMMAGLTYTTTTESSVPHIVVNMMEQELQPAGYEWSEPVFGGLLYRNFKKNPGGGERLAVIVAPDTRLELPEGYESSVQLTQRGEEVWSGSGADFAGYSFLNNGDYKMRVDCLRAADGVRGHGSISFVCNFTVAVEPRMEVSDEWVVQGDVVAVRVFNLPAGSEVSAATDLGEVRFSETGSGVVTGYVPIGHARDASIYNMTVRAGRDEWEVPIRVIEANFKAENIIPAPEEIPTPEQEAEQNRVRIIGQASPADYREYREVIQPLFDTYESTAYWSGLFAQPLQAPIGVDYGLVTYTTGSNESLRQSGVGFDAGRDSPVLAPNAGKVVLVYEGYDIGNTVVIEHGGGLKSLFFFLGDMLVEEGDMVEKGQQIATVGTRRFSDEASVYYEARLGYETVNPKLLFDGASKLYYFT